MNNNEVTIASLAAKFNAQPHEVAAFADLGQMAQDAPLDADTESMIREAWATAPAADSIDTVRETANEESVLADVADILDGAGYDTL